MKSADFVKIGTAYYRAETTIWNVNLEEDTFGNSGCSDRLKYNRMAYRWEQTHESNLRNAQGDSREGFNCTVS